MINKRKKNLYFKNSNNFYHGIMFHHFHDHQKYLKGQGTISKNQFIRIIDFVGKENILNGKEFIQKLKTGKLKKNDLCLTFDDSAKSQIDIALPILKKLNIKGIFFVHTSIFDKSQNLLEIFRVFRNSYKKGMNYFYKDFYKILNRKKDLNIFFKINDGLIKSLKKKFSFYSIDDIKFRLVRDRFLSSKLYEKLMKNLMKKRNFRYKQKMKNLFFSKKDLKNLVKLGHVIGLHSHSHPTLLEKFNYSDQKKEYNTNIFELTKILPKNYNIQCMAHPSGSYNSETLEILKKLNIKVGFKQIMTIEKEKGMKKINNSLLEIAREDHSNILKKMI